MPKQNAGRLGSRTEPRSPVTHFVRNTPRASNNPLNLISNLIDYSTREARP